ncbi:MAG: hypothetical protein BroJett025_00700 [Patescibacteria group bacterium]|nr:MAG: hypothetical protein BroJett025_00700 [Patescibacteria group bacterium]
MAKAKDAKMKKINLFTDREVNMVVIEKVSKKIGKPITLSNATMKNSAASLINSSRNLNINDITAPPLISNYRMIQFVK